LPLLPALGLLLALGFGGSGLISYLAAQASIEAQIAEVALPQTAEIIQAELETQLFQKVAVTRAMAANSFLLQWLDEGEITPGKASSYLAGVQRDVGAITAFFVSETSGRYYHPNGVLKRVSASDPRDRWYYRFRRNPATFEINIDRDTADPQRLTAFINQKVRDQRGQLRGAIGIGVEVRSLSAVMHRIEERYRSEVLFSDHQGQIQLSGAGTGLGRLTDLPGLGSRSTAVLRRAGSSFHYHAGGQTVFVNSRHIPELNWWLVVRQRSGPDSRGILTTLVHNLLIALLISLLVLWLANLTIGDYQRRLEQQAITDPLTGHYNRSAFERLFQAATMAGRRHGGCLAALLVDIDHFKGINDNHGHLVGDEAIRQVGARMADRIRSTDLLFRWGGEEFLLLLPNVAADHGQRLARDLCDSISRQPLQINGLSLPVSVSIGCTLWRPGERALDLVGRADRALYEAKGSGRDQVVTR
jgi:diguanylate cyclase (GGDEF)-like protein